MKEGDVRFFFLRATGSIVHEEGKGKFFNDLNQFHSVELAPPKAVKISWSLQLVSNVKNAINNFALVWSCCCCVFHSSAVKIELRLLTVANEERCTQEMWMLLIQCSCCLCRCICTKHQIHSNQLISQEKHQGRGQ